MKGVALILLVAGAAAAVLVPWTRAEPTAPAAPSFTRTSGTQTMDDGIAIAYDLYLPDGAAPATGWPGIVMLHGLGGTRASVASIAQTFAASGYAVLAYDARGHGASGGNVELASAREVADLRAMRDLLAVRGDVSDTQIGAWGISYGGGQVWNALAAGVPFAAAEVYETWTDLYAALWPQGIARSGLVFGFATTIRARSPLVASIESEAVTSRNLARTKALADDRSSLPRLSSVRTPVYMFQGRQDFAFDIDQAARAYARVGGPKKLYVGAFGHAPTATFPGPDIDHVVREATLWFNRFLRGEQNGVDEGRVVVGSEGTGARRVEFPALPPTRSMTFTLRGTSTARRSALVVRRTPPLRSAVETWGGGTVTVRVRRVSSYPRLVATVRAGAKVVTHGAVRPRVGTNTIRLANYAVHVPRGTRLTVTLGPASPRGTLAYLDFEDARRLTLGNVALRLSTLRNRVTQ